MLISRENRDIRVFCDRSSRLSTLADRLPGTVKLAEHRRRRELTIILQFLSAFFGDDSAILMPVFGRQTGERDLMSDYFSLRRN